MRMGVRGRSPRCRRMHAPACVDDAIRPSCSAESCCIGGWVAAVCCVIVLHRRRGASCGWYHGVVAGGACTHTRLKRYAMQCLCIGREAPRVSCRGAPGRAASVYAAAARVASVLAWRAGTGRVVGHIMAARSLMAGCRGGAPVRCDPWVAFPVEFTYFLLPALILVTASSRERARNLQCGT